MEDDFRSLSLGPPNYDGPNFVARYVRWNEPLMKNGAGVLRPANLEAGELPTWWGGVIRNPLRINGFTYTSSGYSEAAMWNRKTGNFLGFHYSSRDRDHELAIIAYMETYMGLHDFDFDPYWR